MTRRGRSIARAAIRHRPCYTLQRASAVPELPAANDIAWGIPPMLTDEAPLREPINEPLRFADPPAASPLTRQLDDWLDEHPDWFAAASPPRAGEKYIRDPVHGSIVISADEARILDS